MRDYIYFVECAALSAVKIGYARSDIRNRLQQLQCGCPSELTLLGFLKGSRIEEAKVHLAIGSLYGHYRAEWFHKIHAVEFYELAKRAGLRCAINAFQQSVAIRRQSLVASVAAFRSILAEGGLTPREQIAKVRDFASCPLPITNPTEIWKSDQLRAVS